MGPWSQMSIEDRPDSEIADLMEFYGEVGLPICLADLGLTNATDDEIGAIAQITSDQPVYPGAGPAVRRRSVSWTRSATSRRAPRAFKEKRHAQ